MDSFSPATFFAWDEANRAASAGALRGDLLQALTALTMDAGWLRANLGKGQRVDSRLEEMLRQLQGAVASTERIATELKPLMLDPLGLIPALQLLAGQFTRSTGAACELELDERVELEELRAMAVYRIVQDWLRGVGLDGAGHVHVRLDSSDRELILQMQDDGATEGAGCTARGQALAIVGERTHLLRGSVYLDAGSGPGAHLEVRIPLQAQCAG